MTWKKKRVKPDGTQLFAEIDIRLRDWKDRTKPFLVQLKLYPENQKIVFEAVMDYASDRKLNAVIREVNDQVKITNTPLLFNIIFTGKK